ncbi:MAG: signal peptidase II [Chloroflexi bacterium]|nr:signal peptidase II [Chloroflexota bacterium]
MPNRPALRHWTVFLGLIAAIIAVDQIAKALIIARIAPGQTVVVIEPLADFFRLTFSQNTGAAFGMLPSAGWVFSVIAVSVSIVMLIAHARMDRAAWGKRLAMAFIIGGALGNVIDRVRFDYVIDFINYRIPGVISNVSNIADHAIVAGVIALLIITWRAEDEKDATQAAVPPTDTPDTAVE